MQEETDLPTVERPATFAWESVTAREEFAYRFHELLTGTGRGSRISSVDLTLPEALSTTDTDRATDLVRRYMAPNADLLGGVTYTGSLFDTWQGGGSFGGSANRFTDADISAVTMLSVEIPPRAVIELVQSKAGAIEKLLLAIPQNTPLHEAGPRAIAAGSPASDLWMLLRTIDGIGWVKASKLIARKRPHLVPVYDKRVKQLVGSPRDYWEALRLALTANGYQLAERLDAIRRSVAPDMSILRVFDVIAWMEATDKLQAL